MREKSLEENPVFKEIRSDLHICIILAPNYFKYISYFFKMSECFRETLMPISSFNISTGNYLKVNLYYSLTNSETIFHD